MPAFGSRYASMKPHVSIVIPVRHDAEALARVLDHLAGLQHITASEIIVAASGDPLGTERAAAGTRRSTKRFAR